MKLRVFWLVGGLILLLNCGSAWTQTAPQPYQNYATHPRVYTHRHSFWTEANLNGTIIRTDSGAARLQYQTDWQYRRGADFDYVRNGNRNNIFKDPFQIVIRPWLHYWPVPGKLRLSLSPLGYWGTLSPRGDSNVTSTPEFRICPQFSFFQRIGKLDIQQRYRLEMRWLGNSQPVSGHFRDYFVGTDWMSTGQRLRFRYMLRLTYPISKSGDTFLTLWDELFLGFGRNVGNNRIWDQNRLVTMVGQKFRINDYPMKVEVGTAWQVASRFNMNVPPTQPDGYGSYEKNNVENNLALQVYFICDDFLGFLKKKDE